MSYRLLLPCVHKIADTEITKALEQLDARRCTADYPRWRMRNLVREAAEPVDTRLRVSLRAASDVQQKASDRYFFEPAKVRAWIEVRVKGAGVDRPGRLRARLVALTLSEHLALPVLETRNGVYCHTPEAFAAWCAREAHPDTVLMGRCDHITDAPPPRSTVRDRSDIVAYAAANLAPLPSRSLLKRAWCAVMGIRPHIVPVPAGAHPLVLDKFVDEVERTFRSQNVFYDPEHQRLVIYGKDTRQTRQMVSYFRKRARPQPLRAAHVVTL